MIRIATAALMALALLASACSSGSEDAADAATTVVSPDQESTTTASTTPPEPPEIPPVAATITFGEDLGGESVEITKEDLDPVLTAISGSQDFIDLAYNGTLPSDFASLVLTQKIIQTVLAKRLSLEGGVVDPIELVATRGRLDEELIGAVPAPADGAVVAQEVSAYLDLIAQLQATNTAVEQALARSGGSSGVLVPCVRHILVDTEPEAQEILSLLDGGSDFSELAMERSTGPSGPEGGDLGCSSSAGYVPEFKDAVDAADIGTPVGPVQTQFGFHVLIVDRLEESNEDQSNTVLDADLRAITVEVAPVLGAWDSTQLAVLPATE